MIHIHSTENITSNSNVTLHVEVENMSAIGGTMGLLTGFSIISLIETGYFTFKFVFNIIKNKLNI